MTINGGNVTVNGTLKGIISAGSESSSSVIYLMPDADCSATIDPDDMSRITINDARSLGSGVYFAKENDVSWTKYTDVNQLNTTEYSAIRFLTVGDANTYYISQTHTNCVFSNPNLITLDLSNAYYSDQYFIIKDGFQETVETIYMPKNVELQIDFTEIESIKEIVFSENTTTISGSGFKNCVNLSSINLDNMENIGANCLSGCTSLKSLNTPKLETIGNSGSSDKVRGCPPLPLTSN